MRIFKRSKKELRGLKVAVIIKIVVIHKFLETVIIINPYLYSLGKKGAHNTV